MTNTKKLKEKISESGLKMKYIAEHLGLSAYGFALKVDGKSEFKSSEISALCELLKITSLKEKESIFFCLES